MIAPANEFRVKTSGAFTAAHLALVPQLERLTKKKIVVFDEATSNLDLATAEQLDQTINQQQLGRVLASARQAPKEK
jgi:Rad3-related DNA helicase